MRFLSLTVLLLLGACTGEWGDWMQAEKPNEDHQFFCQYYDQCGKGEGKAMYAKDHNVAHSGGGVYSVESGIWGNSGKSDLYGSGSTVYGPSYSGGGSLVGGGSVWGPAQ